MQIDEVWRYHTGLLTIILAAVHVRTELKAPI
jgi:hypothetical protein